MTTQASAENNQRNDLLKASAEKTLGYAIMGLLVTGAVGIFKALDMQSGFDVLLCLLGSAASFGVVAYIYLGLK